MRTCDNNPTIHRVYWLSSADTPNPTRELLLNRSRNPKFAGMKKLVLVALALLLLASCNTAVCPAYSDSANDMKNTIFQKGNHRADGINRVYRDSYQKKLR